MKKIYFLLLVMMTSLSFGQGKPIITMIADGDESGGVPKVLEIYANGTVDFSLYSLQNQTNANTDWGNTFDLSTLGTVTDSFVYVYYDGTLTLEDGTEVSAFAVNFPSVSTTAALDASNSSVLSVNGDDRVRIIETESAAVVDVYGVDSVDGTGTDWEYTDGYAKRLSETGPDPVFVTANWEFHKGELNGYGAVQSSDDGTTNGTTFESIIGLGTYTPPTVAAPSLVITSPTDGQVLTPSTTETEVVFTVSNFTIADGGTGDGYIVYIIDGGTAVNKYDTTPIAVTGLTDGSSHTVTMELVDNNGDSLDPAVSSTVSFSVATSTELTIAEVQTPTDITVSDASPYLDAYVSVTGIVYAVSYNGYFIHDGEGAWNGIFVFDYDNTVAEGDEITIGGVVDEYYNLTQIKDIYSFSVNSSGNPLYAAAEVSTAEANNEEYEGVLLKVSGTCVSEPDSYGVWSVDDSSGPVNVDDKIYAFTPTVDVAYSVTGAGDYNYGSRKILPRSADDVEESTTAINQIDTRFSIYPNPFNQTLNISTLVDVSEVSIIDILGKTVKTYQPDSNLININTSNLEKGIYLLKLKTDSGDVFVKKIIKR